MMIKLAPILLTILATPAIAQIEGMKLASDLGAVIGAEALCNLSLDQDAIAAYVAANAPKDDLGFPGTLSMMIQGSTFSNQGMTGSAKTATCAAVEQAARNFGFMK